MGKRSSYEIKKEILKAVKEKPATYAQLERKVNTGYETVKSNSIELERFGNLKIEMREKHDANGRPYYEVSITDKGREFLETSS